MDNLKDPATVTVHFLTLKIKDEEKQAHMLGRCDSQWVIVSHFGAPKSETMTH